MKSDNEEELMTVVNRLDGTNPDPHRWSAEQLATIYSRVLSSERSRGIPNFPDMAEASPVAETEVLALIDGEYSWIVPVSPDELGRVAVGAPYFVKTTELKQHLEQHLESHDFQQPEQRACILSVLKDVNEMLTFEDKTL